jgi:hypothetical protein
VFGNDGKLYFTTGEHFQAGRAEELDNPRGKLHRINPDGSIPSDNPFNDGDGPNWDSIWAYGLRNPFRACYDAPTGRLYVADVGGNSNDVAEEEVNVAARGANYGWPESEGACTAPCRSPVFSYAHDGRDAAITGGFLPRHPVPRRVPGQLLLRRLHPELDQATHVRRLRRGDRGGQLRASQRGR